MLILLMLAGTAPAQYLVPVDQAVSDLDPLAISLRRVELGLSVYGEQTHLFRVEPGLGQAEPGQPTYYRIGPGFQARVRRIDYVTLINPFPVGRLRPEDIGLNVSPRIDGAFIESIGPDTVFDLTNPILPPFVLPDADELARDRLMQRPVHDPWVDPRLDLRIGSRLDDRLYKPDIDTVYGPQPVMTQLIFYRHLQPKAQPQQEDVVEQQGDGESTAPQQESVEESVDDPAVTSDEP